MVMTIKVMPSLLALKGENIFLFGCPIHPNLGDQAQTICLENWLRKNYPDHTIFKFNWRISYLFALKLLRKKIGPGDLIFFHSGYLLTDHHRELPVYCNVVHLFPDYRIVIFPQTINFHKTQVQSKVASIFNAHPKLILLCRDEVSFSKAETTFSNSTRLLYPDVVTTLIGNKMYNNKRDGILFCTRNDKEAHYKPYEIMELKKRLNQETQTFLLDTTIQMSPYSLAKNREKAVYTMLNEFSKFQVIITDRYHGTIFAMATATPVIVLSSADHKLSSGVKWFPEIYSDYYEYVDNLEEAFNTALIFLKRNYDHVLPSYFQENYYEKLRKEIE